MVIKWNNRAQRLQRLSGIMKLKRKRKAAKLATLRIKKIFRDEKRNSAKFKEVLKKLKGVAVSSKKKESKGQNAAQETEVAPKQQDPEMPPAENKKKAKKRLKVANKKVSTNKAKAGKDKPAVKKNKKPPKKVKAAKVLAKKKVVAKKGKGATLAKRPHQNFVKDAGQVLKVLNPNSTKGRPIKAAVSVTCTKCHKPIFHSFFSQAKDVCECRGTKKATFGAFWQTSVPDDDHVKTTAIYRVDDRTLCSRTRTDRGRASRVNMVLTMGHGSFVFSPQSKSSN